MHKSKVPGFKVKKLIYGLKLFLSEWLSEIHKYPSTNQYLAECPDKIYYFFMGLSRLNWVFLKIKTVSIFGGLIICVLTKMLFLIFMFSI